MYLGSWKIDDYVTFCVNTHDPDTGVATDADAVPTYRVYEDETTTPILTGSMALLDAANTAGFYSERIQLTAGNGFEKGKSYTIYITATVDSDTGTMHHVLQVEAEVDANTISASLNDPTAATIADAVWDETSTGHIDAGKAGQQLWTDLDAVLADTNELQTDDYPTSIAAIKTETALIVADTNELQTDDVPGLISGLNDPTAATIADAVWDEAASGHTAAGSTGKALTDGITAGAGAITFTYTLTSSVDSTPVADADVWASSDQAGNNILASGTTDSNGQVVFYLDTGTVYIWRQKSGWNFTNPDIETVS